MKKELNHWVYSYPILKKIIMELKIAIPLLLFSVTTLMAEPTYSQTAKINLAIDNKKLELVMDEIERQSEFYFIFNQKQIDVDRVISIRANNELINSVLPHLFNGTNVNFAVVDRKIFLTTEPIQSEVITLLAAEKVVLKRITGIVSDKTGNPLPGVNVFVTGTNQGVTTDISGKYTIEIPDNAGSLTFSYIGMQSQEVILENQTVINIVLTELAIGLDEVVVIGYGTQKRVNLTGSVVSTKGSDILKSQAPNVVNSLVGRLPGVIINSRSGEPGQENPAIFIRGRSTTGNASPLILIDGIERGGLGQINPNDIENVTVLKDASAAIYGAKAANGVILVTTKQGKLGKPVIDFSYNQGFTQPTRNPIMADSYTFGSVMNEIDVSEGRTPRYSAGDLQKYKEGTDPNFPNTDWYDFITKTLTPMNKANVSVSGGTDRFKYYFSVGEVSQDGQFINGTTKVKRYNLRSNIEAKITENFKIGLNLAGRLEDKHYPRWTGAIYSHVFLYHPTWQPYWPGTNYLTPNRDGDNILNWVDDTGMTSDQRYKGLESTLNYRWDIKWIKGLWIDGSVNYDAGFNFNEEFIKPTFVYYKNPSGTGYVRGQSGAWPGISMFTATFDQTLSTTINTKVNYARKFGDHNLDLMAGYEQNQGRYNWFNAYRENFVSTALPQLFAGSSNKNEQANDGSASESARLNYFGRASYDYKGKYLAQFILRYDGSTNFPADKRFGLFPSISAGWRISEEKFMQDLGFVNNLKIRASYGEMGNDRVAAFQYLTSYGYGNNFVIGGNDVTGLIQSGVPNLNITWEVAKTGNIGIESSLWDGLLGIEFDLFKTRRSNILTKRTAVIPDYTGLKLPDENVGIVENKGFELQITHSNTKREFKYNLSGNVSFARNKVIFADEAPAAEPYQMITGMPMGSPLVYKAIGIFRDQAEIDAYPHMSGAKPGDIKYEDLNGDKKLNSLDRFRFGETTTPEIVFGLLTSFQYKAFDLNILFQGQANATVFFASHHAAMSSGMGNFTMWRANDRWTPDNPDGTMPRASQEVWNNNTNTSTHWAVDASFLKMKTLELGYNLPASLTQKLRVQKFRIYLSGENLLIMYDHMKELGFDPETSSYWYYPQQRAFNCGLVLTF
jgi:TonB-linked SusC/RagA family outer membrane protein